MKPALSENSKAKTLKYHYYQLNASYLSTKS